MGKPPPRSRPRTASRVAAVQALFQSEQTGETVETIVDQFIRHRLGELPGSGGFEEGRGAPPAPPPVWPPEAGPRGGGGSAPTSRG